MVASRSLESFAQQLDQSPLTRTMWLLWSLSAGLIALDGFDFFIIGVAMPFLQQDFRLNPAEVGAVAVAAIVGSLIGSLTLGPLTDRVGRQRMLLIDVILFVIASAGSAFAWSAASLIGFRFLVGIAIGADYPISVAYITENVPTRLRGRMVVGAFAFQAVGALMGALVGVGIIAAFQLFSPNAELLAIKYAWRWMFGVGLILAIAVGLLRLSFLLESPSYYLARGEYDKAAKAATLLLEMPIVLTPETDSAETESPLSYRDLFSPAYRRRTLLASIPWFLQDIATYGIGIFTPTIIAALAFASQPDLLHRELASVKGAAIVDLFLIAGFVIAILSVDRIGRIRLQIGGFIGMAIGLLILASSAWTSAESWNTAIVFLGFFVFNLTMNAGPNSTTFLLSGEVFPTPIRASGAGFAAAVAKAGAVVGAFGLPILQTSIGVAPLLVGLAGICLFAAVLTFLFQDRKAA